MQIGDGLERNNALSKLNCLLLDFCTLLFTREYNIGGKKAYIITVGVKHFSVRLYIDCIVTKCGFVSRNILGRRCKPLEARAAGNVAA